LYIVVVAIASLGIDSLNTTGRELSDGCFFQFDAAYGSFHYRCGVDGSIGGRSDFCKFQGFQPKRVFPNPRTNLHNTHTSRRIEDDTSHFNSYPSTTRLTQQSTRYRGHRTEMGKRDGTTSTEQQMKGRIGTKMSLQLDWTGNHPRTGAGSAGRECT
jgi:hypothetical protein